MTSTNKEEKKALVVPLSVMTTLMPKLPNVVRISLTDKQNFALCAEEIFCHALNRTVWDYRDNYDILEAIFKQIKNTAVESIATDAGLSRISDIVFGDSVVREFISTLRTQFYSQFSEFHAYWNELLLTIAYSITSNEISKDANMSFSLVPEDLQIRTYDADHMRNLFLANSWLVIFILVVLWGRIYSYAELKSIAKQTN